MKKFRITTNGKLFRAEVKTWLGWKQWFEDDYFYPTLTAGGMVYPNQSYAGIEKAIRAAYGDTVKIMENWLPAFGGEKK